MKKALLDPKFWRDRSVFVTGATGLLGSWMTKALVDAQANVVALVRDEVPRSNFHRLGLAAKVTQVRGALEDAEVLRRSIAEYEIDTVFHLGAQTIVGTATRHPLGTLEANVRGTYDVLEACRQSAKVKRVVIASTDKVYGDHGSTPYTEDLPLLGCHPYDLSKACADQLALGYHRFYQLPVVTTRFGNLFGGGDLNWNRIVPGAVRSALRGEPLVIRSNGQFIRDYIFVGDAVAAYGLLAERAAEPGIVGRAYNFSNEVPRTVVEMARAVFAAAGKPDTKLVIEGGATDEIPSQTLSAARAREALGWAPHFDLETALGETVAWYRDYLASSADA